MGAVMVLAITLGMLAILPNLVRLASRSLQHLGILPQPSRLRFALALSETASELDRIRLSGVYWKLMGLSLLVRLAKYGSLYMLLYAMVEPLGYALADMPPMTVFIGLVAPELAASLPISGIAGFGAYEGTWAFIFNLLLFPADLAKLTAISHHLFTQVYGAILGATALVILMTPLFAWSSSKKGGIEGPHKG
jgi:uncharacterized membrane protein YbhN (UPF0104 family)